MAKRREKKSESLEIRLPHSQKSAFMNACQEKGISASEALRSQIELFLTEGEETPSPRINYLGATLRMIRLHSKKTIATLAGLAASACMIAVMPSAADDELFTSYDRNGDGVLTEGEISANDSKVIAILDQDGSGTITPDEFKQNAEVIRTLDFVDKSDEGEDVRTVEVEQTRLALDEDQDVKVYVQRWAEQIDPGATDEEVEAVIEKLKVHLEKLEGLEGLERMHELDEMERAEHEHVKVITELHLSELEELGELKELEKLHKLEHLKELSELSELSEMEHQEILKELEGLEGLEGDEKVIIIRREKSVKSTSDETDEPKDLTPDQYFEKKSE